MSVKVWHEFRDPVHQFITVDVHERRVVDSRPVQRLRQVHQLAMSYLVYPGATHRRFEHSLGVMELAGKVFDVLTSSDNLTDDIRDLVPQVNATHKFSYWKSVVRMAALCHDVGHLPFSHAAEHDMLPQGTSHESLTEELILNSSLKDVLQNMEPPIRPETLAKLAVGPKKSDKDFDVWEALLSEIITGDAFGVDRMDYLLRDSLHTGVAYGRFDHNRLIGTLRILPAAPQDSEEGSRAPAIGVTHGGLHSAEALQLARYYMFSQVYFHPIRVIYDRHLIDFMREWLTSGRYVETIEEHLNIDDNDVLLGLRKAAANPSTPGHVHAKRIVTREHMKRVYERSPSDLDLSPDPAAAVERWAIDRFGAENVRRLRTAKDSGSLEFPVRESGGQVASSLALSDMLRRLPEPSADRVFVDSSVREAAEGELKNSRSDIISSWTESEDDNG